jgi:hypothetical protein
MKGLKASQKKELLVLWYSFNTNSLNIPSIRPTSMAQFCSSLVGKDFQIILQAAPFIFFNLWILPRSRSGCLSAILAL